MHKNFNFSFFFLQNFRHKNHISNADQVLEYWCPFNFITAVPLYVRVSAAFFHNNYRSSTNFQMHHIGHSKKCCDFSDNFIALLDKAKHHLLHTRVHTRNVYVCDWNWLNTSKFIFLASLFYLSLVDEINYAAFQAIL